MQVDNDTGHRTRGKTRGRAEVPEIDAAGVFLDHVAAVELCCLCLKTVRFCPADSVQVLVVVFQVQLADTKKCEDQTSERERKACHTNLLESLFTLPPLL